MAFYDSGPSVTYDSSLTYDQAVFINTPKKHMAKVKLNLDRLGDGPLILKAKDYKVKLTGNANFPTTTPTLVEFGVLITNAETALAASDAANATAKQKTTEKNTAMDALRRGTAQLGNSVELTSGGDAAKIQSAGMDVKAAAAPVGELPAPQSLSATGGDQEGECDLHWEPVDGRTGYLAEHRTTPSGPWIQFYAGKKSSATCTGLVAGTQYDFRVRAVGAAGPGAWSDIAQSRAT